MMFVPDTPAVSVQGQTVMVSEVKAPAVAPASKKMKVGVCFPVQNVQGGDPGLANATSPSRQALNALYKFDSGFRSLSKSQQQKAFDTWGKVAKVSLVEMPDKGEMERDIPGFQRPSSDIYVYIPEPRDMGKHRATFMVEIGGYSVKLIYTFHLTENGEGPETEKQYCGKRGTLYRVVDEVQKRTAP